MSGRGATPAVIAEMSKVQQQPGHLFALYLDDGTLFLTDFTFPISFGGNDYLPSAILLSYQGLSESAQLEVQQATFVLSGVDGTVLGSLMNYPFVDRRVVVYQAYLDSGNAVIADPFSIFDGHIDSASSQEEADQETGAITGHRVTVIASNQWANFDQHTGRRTNSASQQLLYPTDRFFDIFMTPSNNMKWGSE